jgi:hypothetical protein
MCWEFSNGMVITDSLLYRVSWLVENRFLWTYLRDVIGWTYLRVERVIEQVKVAGVFLRKLSFQRNGVSVTGKKSS